MSCFQSIGNAKPNGIQSTQYMQLVQFQTILGMDPPESAWVSVCVWYSLCVDMRPCHNEYVSTCQLPVPTSTYAVSCRCNTHVPYGPSQIAANAPILPQPQSLASRQQKSTLSGKQEARYNGAPCSQHIPLYHNIPQCAGSLIGQLWPFGGRCYYKKQHKCIFVSVFAVLWVLQTHGASQQIK